MPQTSFRYVGPDRPWSIVAPLNAVIMETRTPIQIVWATGSPDTIPDHLAVVVYGGSTFPDGTVGKPYAIFTVQGSHAWYAITLDLVSTIPTLVGADTVWGIVFWWDGSQVPTRWQPTQSGRRVVMVPGYTFPPIPEETVGGDDWIYTDD